MIASLGIILFCNLKAEGYMSLSSIISLRIIHENAINQLITVKNVQYIFGIGSFFAGKKKHPHDLDYYVVFNKKFLDLNIKQLSETFEKIKGAYRNEKYEPIINIFIEDADGNKLNSVDLWFILNFNNEKLANCITDQMNQIWINDRVILLYSV